MRRWKGSYDFKAMLQEMPGGLAFAVRDFALMALAGELSLKFPGQLVLKGGFVLRHGHGHLRFSTDIDATRHDPPQNKFDAASFAETIRGASIKNLVDFDPEDPATNSGRSLDFNTVRVSGEDFVDARVQVEVSYREGVIAPPREIELGEPFYEPSRFLRCSSTRWQRKSFERLLNVLRNAISPTWR